MSCKNCGADQGLHQSETMKCPLHGIEETRYDKLNERHYPQRWAETVFDDNAEQEEIESLKSQLQEANASIEKLQNADSLLNELYRLKTLKDAEGKTDEYCLKQPETWKEVKKYLTQK